MEIPAFDEIHVNRCTAGDLDTGTAKFTVALAGMRITNKDTRSGERTGRYTMAPGATSGTSMFPPWLSGVNELIESISGEQLNVPMCGL